MSEFAEGATLTGWLVVWPVLIPVLAAALAAAAWGAARAQAWIGVLGLLGQLASSIILFAYVLQNGPLAMSMGGWQAPFGIALAADTLGAGLTVIAALVGVGIMIYSLGDTDAEDRRAGFVPLMLALMTGVAGAFLTSDIFNLYVWFEVTLISSFGLIVLGGRREQLDGAVKYAFLNLIATTMLLIAIGLLYGMTGTLNMADLSGKVAALPQDAALETLAMLFLVSLGMKSALFPLYFWLPAAYHTPRPTVSAVFAALLTKVGVYSLIRVFMTVFPESGDLARDVMVWAAVATMVLGALGALAEADIRRLVSFTVISGVGVMIAGLAIGSETALLGAFFYLVHSIIISGALFMIVGLVSRAGGGSQVDALSGLYNGAPLLAVVFLLSGLSLAGIPPFAGFWPKVYLVQAGLEAEAYALVVAVLVSGFLTLLVVGRTFALVFWREAPNTDVQSAGKPPIAAFSQSMVVPSVLLAALTLGIGLYSSPLADLSARAAGELLDPGPYIDAVLADAQAETPIQDTASLLGETP